MTSIRTLILLSIGCVDIAPAQLRGAPCSVDADCSSEEVCHRAHCLKRQRVCDNDGLTETGEACDDGNDRNDDACTTQCELARCGDGIVRTDLSIDDAAYEVCEPGLDNDFYCDDRCRPVQRHQRLRAYRHKTCWIDQRRVLCWGAPTHAEPVPQAVFDSPWKVRSDFVAMSLYDSGQPHQIYVRESSGLIFRFSELSQTGFQLEFASPAVLTTRAISFAPTHACAAQEQPLGVVCWDQCVPAFGEKVWRLSDSLVILDVAVSQYIGCSVTDAHEVDCWGGQDDNTTVQPCLRRNPYMPVRLTDVHSLSANLTSFVARHIDGSVSQWSGRWNVVDGAEILQVNLPEPAQQVVSMVGRHCALLLSGRVACWEASDARFMTEREVVVVEGLDDVVNLSEASYAEHLCAQKSDNSIWCWGKNDWGQLGDGSNEDRARPVRTVVVDQEPILPPWHEAENSPPVDLRAACESLAESFRGECPHETEALVAFCEQEMLTVDNGRIVHRHSLEALEACLRNYRNNCHLPGLRSCLATSL